MRTDVQRTVVCVRCAFGLGHELTKSRTQRDPMLTVASTLCESTMIEVAHLGAEVHSRAFAAQKNDLLWLDVAL